MQVVGAVGYDRQRLPIPDDIQPEVASLIRDCWKEKPSERPGFDEVLSRLNQLTAINPSLSCAAHRAQRNEER